MPIYKRPQRPNELYHWGNSKPKYIAKIGNGPDARYFYTQEELNAYKKEKRSENAKTLSGIGRNTINDFVTKNITGSEYKRREALAKERLDNAKKSEKEYRDAAFKDRLYGRDYQKNADLALRNKVKQEKAIDRNQKQYDKSLVGATKKAAKDFKEKLTDFKDTAITGEKYKENVRNETRKQDRLWNDMVRSGDAAKNRKLDESTREIYEQKSKKHIQEYVDSVSKKTLNENKYLNKSLYGKIDKLIRNYESNTKKESSEAWRKRITTDVKKKKR